MPNHPCPVRIRGVDYPSISAAAEALGLSHTTIHSHLNRGTLDNAGIGRGYGAAHRTTNAKQKAITLGGMHFPSHSALSRYLGKSNGYVSEALRTGQYYRIIKAFKAAKLRDEKAKRPR